MHAAYSYGLWPLVVINSLIFILFALSFTRPRTGRDWRSFGAFSAFIVALFTEMYGIPLTIYVLSGWLQSRQPGLDLFSHEAGHLWNTLLGWKVDAYFDLFHLASSVLLVVGFVLVASAWKALYKAQRSGDLATTGPYARIRHPQYVGFVLVLFSFLLQWPTLLTLAMFPLLVVMYVRLARREEAEARAQFGEVFDRWVAETPAFLPQLGKSSPSARIHPDTGGAR